MIADSHGQGTDRPGRSLGKFNGQCTALHRNVRKAAFEEMILLATDYV